MAGLNGEVVLVTGASGFLGQHIVKHLQKDDAVKEIRVLDKIPYKNTIGHLESKPLKTFEHDLCNKESCSEAIKGADVVMHCAALVSYDFPPDREALHLNNVLATKNLIDLCIEESVGRLVHCSTTEVTLQSYVRGGIFAMVVYCQESRLKMPENEDRLIFGDYAASKLGAEKLVLGANGNLLQNGKGVLRTVSLRPPKIYGEGDEKFIAKILQLAKSRGNSLMRPAGVGGKQQLAYAGNVAWAFICAKDTLRYKPENIEGLPVIVTDDTMVEDLLRFCERLTRNSEHHVSFSWSVPTPVSYFLAFVAELVIKHFGLKAGICKRIPVSPRSAIAYLGSVILYNRTRASIHMNYIPIYSAEEALKIATDYYCEASEK